jgi:tetratricopeptide (TPR) repeat protein
MNNNLKKIDMTKSEKYYKEGNLLFDKREYNKAIDCYLKAIELNPNSKVLFNKLFITCGKHDSVIRERKQYKGKHSVNPVLF